MAVNIDKHAEGLTTMHKFLIVFSICLLINGYQYVNTTTSKCEGLGCIADGLLLTFFIIGSCCAIIGVLLYGFTGAVVGVMSTPIVFYVIILLINEDIKRKERKRKYTRKYNEEIKNQKEREYLLKAKKPTIKSAF